MRGLSHLEIREPGSSPSRASYVQWKACWGGNVDKTGEITISSSCFLSIVGVGF